MAVHRVSACLVPEQVMTQHTCFWITGARNLRQYLLSAVSFCSRAGYCLITTFWYWAGCSSIACTRS